MPETKAAAKRRAKKLGMPLRNVTKSKCGYYIAPSGIKTSRGRKTYAALRCKGKSKAQAAKIAYSVDHKK